MLNELRSRPDAGGGGTEGSGGGGRTEGSGGGGGTEGSGGGGGIEGSGGIVSTPTPVRIETAFATSPSLATSAAMLASGENPIAASTAAWLAYWPLLLPAAPPRPPSQLVLAQLLLPAPFALLAPAPFALLVLALALEPLPLAALHALAQASVLPLQHVGRFGGATGSPQNSQNLAGPVGMRPPQKSQKGACAPPARAVGGFAAGDGVTDGGSSGRVGCAALLASDEEYGSAASDGARCKAGFVVGAAAVVAGAEEGAGAVATDATTAAVGSLRYVGARVDASIASAAAFTPCSSTAAAGTSGTSAAAGGSSVA